MPKDKADKKIMVVEEVAEEAPEVVSEAKVENNTPKIEDSNPQESVQEYDTEEDVEKVNYLWIIVPTALLIGALAGGFITYFSGISKISTEVAVATSVPSAVSKPTSSPVASPKSEINREDVKIQVLNGSGISGLAGKAKTMLEDLGYKGVVTGNAEVSNLVETTISYKETMSNALEQIKKDLGGKYKLSEKEEVLPSTSKYDFVITLGNK